jgi:hypothetical protein
MAHLVDTNILVRLANAADARHAEATRAVVELHRRGEVLHVTPQVLIEFRNVATRPTAMNGLAQGGIIRAFNADEKAAPCSGWPGPLAGSLARCSPWRRRRNLKQIQGLGRPSGRPGQRANLPRHDGL